MKTQTKRLYFSLPTDLTISSGHIYTFKLTLKDEEPNPQPARPILNADKGEIFVDNVDAVTFEVSPMTAKIIGVGHDYAGTSGSTFSSSVPGVYKFKAVNEGLETEEVAIVAFGAPNLRVDKDVLKVVKTANLMVIFKEFNRTADAIFTKNGMQFEGNQFTPEQCGVFTYVATVDGYFSNEVTITV